MSVSLLKSGRLGGYGHRAAAASLAALVFGCGGDRDVGKTPDETACSPNVAEIGIGDGYFQNICGCDEPAGRFVLSPGSLTCSAPLGTSFFFEFLTTRGVHQILSIGTPDFPSSPLNDPSGVDTTIRAHVIHPTAAGTYLFEDITDGALTGALVVY